MRRSWQALKFAYHKSQFTWQQDTDRSFKGVADFPAAIFAQELVDNYPEAAIILSTRPEDAWVKSMMSTLWHAYSNMPANSTSPMAPLATKYHTLCWGNDFPSKGREYFRKHNDMVRELGKGKRFLEWDVKEGWDPICGYLGLPVPSAPFPRDDDWVSYKREVEKQEASSVHPETYNSS